MERARAELGPRGAFFDPALQEGDLGRLEGIAFALGRGSVSLPPASPAAEARKNPGAKRVANWRTRVMRAGRKWDVPLKRRRGDFFTP